MALALTALAPALAGCGENTMRAFGWEKSSPDEFTVVTQAPLSQPPDFNLRPPTEGAQRTLPSSTTEQARKVLVGVGDASLAPSSGSRTANANLDGYSLGEQALLKKAGAVNVSQNIRRQVDEETTALAEESKSFTDDILFWQEKPAPGEILDPVKEAKRLESNASLGQPVTQGDTPQIVRRQKGWLEGIF